MVDHKAAAGEATTTRRTRGPRRIVSLLDYGAGNVRSVRNAIIALGYEVEDITTVEEIQKAEMIIFPGKFFYFAKLKSFL